MCGAGRWLLDILQRAATRQEGEGDQGGEEEVFHMFRFVMCVCENARRGYNIKCADDGCAA